MGRGRGTTTPVGKTVARRGVSGGTSSWQEVRQGIASLKLNSYEVGGSIRNEILGKEPDDIDVCVAGVTYDQLQARCLEKGIKFEPLEVEGQLIGGRVVASWTPADGVEIALARKEVSTGDSHTAFKIETDPEFNITDDLMRRDFTCNAIAQEILSDGSLGERIDPTGGAEDIKKGILRAVSDRTLTEDPLRVLRGFVRVAADNLRPDSDTTRQMLAQSKNLGPEGPLSADRRYKELKKLISKEGAADSLRLMRSLDEEGTIFKAVFPELAPMVGFDQDSKYHDLDVDEHCFQVLDRACREDMPEAVRWAALLHDSGKPVSAWRGKDGRLHYYWNKKVPESRAHDLEGEKIARKVLQELKVEKKLQEDVEILVRNHMFGTMDNLQARAPEKTALKTRQLIQKVGRDHIDDLVLLRRCDWGGKGNIVKGWDDDINLFQEIVEREKKQPLEVKDLAIGGNEIMELGLSGREVGETLRELLHQVVIRPEDNTEEKLLTRARKIAEKSRNQQ